MLHYHVTSSRHILHYVTITTEAPLYTAELKTRTFKFSSYDRTTQIPICVRVSQTIIFTGNIGGKTNGYHTLGRYVMQMGVGGVSNFPEKSVTKV